MAHRGLASVVRYPGRQLFGELLRPAFSLGLPPYDLLVPGEEGVGVDGGPVAAPAALTAYPNPFNPRTTIAWRGLPAGRGTLAVYTVDGRLVTRQDLGEIGGEGQVAWTAAGPAGSPLPGGLYLARVTVAGLSRTARLVLLK